MSNKECRKVNALHLWYTIAIAIIIFVLGILIIPYCVSKYAFDNFSFAATITSIVLAVVSIGYSSVAGNESSKRLESIGDIESKIQEKLRQFDQLDESIKRSLQNGMQPLQESVSNVSSQLGDLNKTFSKQVYFQPEKACETTSTHAHASASEKFNAESVPLVMLLALLACSYHEKNNEVPLSLFDFDSSFSKGYACAALMALSFSNAKRLSVQIRNKDILEVNSFDSNYWGTTETLKSTLSHRSKNSEFSKLLTKVVDYYENQPNIL